MSKNFQSPPSISSSPLVILKELSLIIGYLTDDFGVILYYVRVWNLLLWGCFYNVYLNVGCYFFGIELSGDWKGHLHWKEGTQSDNLLGDNPMICEAVSNCWALNFGSNIEGEIAWLPIKNLQNFWVPTAQMCCSGTLGLFLCAERWYFIYSPITFFWKFCWMACMTS